MMKTIKCPGGCNKLFSSEQSAKDHERDKHKKRESMTFFEMQQEAWLYNDCHGAIESYEGNEY